MRDFLAMLLFIFGIVFSVYLGGWVLGVGGIVDVIEAIRANPVNSLKMAIGFVKFFVAYPVAWITFIGCTCLAISTEK